MKILVVSMLRIGDVILHEAIIKKIRRTHPSSHISCLINDECLGIRGLISDVDEWIAFPRLQLQQEMNQHQRWIFAPLLGIEFFLQELKSNHYDQVINLTHSVISGHICGYLQDAGAEVRGLSISANGQLLKGDQTSDALRYMNNEWATETEPLLHYIEMLSLVVGYPSSFQTNVEKQRPKTGRITFQITTSDQRKHFPISRWIEILEKIHLLLPNYQFQLLTSPQELVSIQKQIELHKLSSELQRILEIKPCSFGEGLDLIEGSDLFVSHDTSLLHLAARTNTPIVQISLGSSHIFKTSSLKAGTVVVSAQTSCFPCRHKSTCHQPRLFCQEDLKDENILEAIQFRLGKIGHELPSSLSMVQIVGGLWWLQNKKKQRNFSHKQVLYTSLSGHLKSEQFLLEAKLESNHSETSDLSFG